MIEHREIKIVLLSLTRNDFYAAKTLRLASQPGPAPSGRVPCSCARVREVRVQETAVKTLVADPYCLVCGGYALRAFNPRLDQPGDEEADAKGYVTDLYTLGADRSDKTRVVLAEPRKLERDPDDRDPWERRHPSYALLDRALDSLRVRDEVAWYYHNAAYLEQRYGMDGLEPRVGFTAGLCLVRALGFVERRMPRPIRLPGELQQRYDEWERTRRINGSKGEGVREVARLEGYDRRTVRKRMKGAA